MNISKKHNRFSRGFTLVEILVIVAIIALITGITLASIKSSKNKAVDVDTRKTLSEIALKAEGQEIAPGVIDYSKAFTTIAAPTAIVDLAAKLNITDSDYQYITTPTSYAIVFPLKKGGYYCVDSASRATGKEVTGLIETTGPQNCSNATRVVVRPPGWDGDGKGGGGGGGNQAPVITLYGANPDPQTYYANDPNSYSEPGYAALDPEDGDITSLVVVSTVVITSYVECHASTYKEYTVTDSGGATTVIDREADGIQPMTAQPQCGNIPSDPIELQPQ